MAKLPIQEPKSGDRKLAFSFEYYDIGSSGARGTPNSYCLRDFDENEIMGALVRLKEISGKTWSEMGRQAKGYHFHQVDWTQTTESKYPYRGAMAMSPFQFSLVGVNNSKARVYGSYSDGVFYIVWFDLEHKIWPSYKQNT